jgi:hypothetical protein
MKVNITVVATKTLMAGLEPADVAILQGITLTAYRGKPYEDSIAGREFTQTVGQVERVGIGRNFFSCQFSLSWARSRYG